jgi:hypothetical protein
MDAPPLKHHPQIKTFAHLFGWDILDKITGAKRTAALYVADH